MYGSFVIWWNERINMNSKKTESGVCGSEEWHAAQDKLVFGLKTTWVIFGRVRKKGTFPYTYAAAPPPRERERSKIFNAAKKRKLNLHKNLQLKPQQQQKIHNHLHTSFHLFSFEWKIGAGNISICLLSINIHSWVVYLIVLNEHWENESRKKHKF